MKQIELDMDELHKIKDTCYICFEEISDKAKPIHCIHECCFECLLNWAEQSETCPVCKHEIDIIVKDTGEEIGVEQRGF